ncbi:MAG: riboflavin synthase [Armatimonadetes bacterium]|nr:riboflavin synthase [Armatimonadota bacterium]
MFTGLVEEVGRLRSLERSGKAARLSVEAQLVSQDARIGDSIAVNGCCLTVVAQQGPVLSFEAVPETVERTSLKRSREGEGVNLERSLAVGQRLGGHFVQGHIDGTAVLRKVEPRENARFLTLELEAPLLRYVVPKGSIALEGISLTVVDVLPAAFTVWIIPHTYSHTNLSDKRPGDLVNVETDILARYVERLLRGRLPEGLTLEKLRGAGYLE